MEPIMEFKDEAQAYGFLKEWQSKLFLDDWIIKLKLIPLTEMADQNHIGENLYQPINRTSLIHIGKFTDMGNGMCKTPHELTLVHELLHLKFILTDNTNSTVEGEFFGMYEHMLIEQIAKSLIMAKYNLSFEWFKNF